MTLTREKVSADSWLPLKNVHVSKTDIVVEIGEHRHAVPLPPTEDQYRSALWSLRRFAKEHGLPWRVHNGFPFAVSDTPVQKCEVCSRDLFPQSTPQVCGYRKADGCPIYSKAWQDYQDGLARQAAAKESEEWAREDAAEMMARAGFDVSQ